MARPTDVGSHGEAVYDQLHALAWDDENKSWALLVFVGGIGQMVQEIEGYVREGDNDEPGWSSILDLDLIPEKGLGWLAQFQGISIDPKLADAEQRERIRETDGWVRGTALAFAGAAKPYLTGSKHVTIRERHGGAYRTTVHTYTAETPDPAAVLAALLEQKPIGIILTYAVYDGQDYQDVYDNYLTYQAVYDAYATAQDLLDDTP